MLPNRHQTGTLGEDQRTHSIEDYIHKIWTEGKTTANDRKNLKDIAVALNPHRTCQLGQ